MKLTVDHGAHFESPPAELVERELTALAARADSCIDLIWESRGTLTAHAAGNGRCIVGFMPEDVDAPKPTLVDPSQEGDPVGVTAEGVDSEFPPWLLVPLPLAAQAFRHFQRTGRLDTALTWTRWRGGLMPKFDPSSAYVP